MLRVENLRFGYRAGPAVLDGLSLTVSGGEIYCLLGPNGAGKSTLLAIILGFLRPQRGTVIVDGIDACATPELARQRLSYLPESVALWEHFTGAEHVKLFAELLAMGVDPEEALTTAGLPQSAWNRPVGEYSKGMRQKLALVLATLRPSAVALLDEPTSGLDPDASEAITRSLQNLTSQGTAVLVVSHDLLRMAGVAHRLGVLSAGKVVYEFKPDGAAEALEYFRRHRRPE